MLVLGVVLAGAGMLTAEASHDPASDAAFESQLDDLGLSSTPLSALDSSAMDTLIADLNGHFGSQARVWICHATENSVDAIAISINPSGLRGHHHHEGDHFVAFGSVQGGPLRGNVAAAAAGACGQPPAAPSGDATLSALALSAGTLSPAFASGTTSYTASVDHGTAQVTVTPAASHPDATVTVNGAPASTPVALNVGVNAISVLVTAQDGTTQQTYTVTVTQAAPPPPPPPPPPLLSGDATLSALALSAGTLAPAFASGTTSYTATVTNATNSVLVTPTPNHAGATATVHGEPGAQSVPLAVAVNTVTVVVTAEDGTTQQIYTVAITRPTALASLTLSVGTLAPPFDPEVTQYVVSVGNLTEEVTITPVAEEGVTITVNGQPAPQTVPLAEGTNLITVGVTIGDVSTERTYEITVNRHVLRSLTATGDLAPDAPTCFSSQDVGDTTPQVDLAMPIQPDGVWNQSLSVCATFTSVQGGGDFKVAPALLPKQKQATLKPPPGAPPPSDPPSPQSFVRVGPAVHLTSDGFSFGRADFCLPYDRDEVLAGGGTDDDVLLLHVLPNDEVEDVTTERRPAQQLICGETTHFSVFFVAMIGSGTPVPSPPSPPSAEEPAGPGGGPPVNTTPPSIVPGEQPPASAPLTGTAPAGSAPAIGGVLYAGQRIEAMAGSWTGSPPPVLAYQWLRCNEAGERCLSIPGATTSTYLLGALDVGSTLRVTVTATNAWGQASTTSAATGPVTTLEDDDQGQPPRLLLAPVITGTALPGAVLTAHAGLWAGDATIEFVYQWQRCDAHGEACVDVPGATGRTLLVGPQDLDSTFRVGVRAVNDAGEAFAVSAWLGPVPSGAAGRTPASSGIEEMVPGPANTGGGPLDHRPAAPWFALAFLGLLALSLPLLRARSNGRPRN